MSDHKPFFDPSQGLDLGIKYLEEKNYKLAIKAFNKVLEFNPENEVAIIKLGHSYLQQEDYPQAIEYFNRALELDPEAIDPHEGLAFCCFGQGHVTEAIEKFNHVLRFNPESEHAHFGLALCYHQREEFDRAIEECRHVLRINPSHPQVYSHIGMCYYKKKNYSQAIEQFNQALRLNSRDPYAHKGLAQVYLKQDKPALCFEELQKVKDIGLVDESYHYLLSQLYMRQKDYDPAIEELKRSLNDYVEEDTKIFPVENNIARQQHNCAIKILRIPNFYGTEILSTEMNSIMVPPLALASIVSYVRSRGIVIEQDDLHIKTHYDNYFGDMEKRIDESPFFDISRVIGYAKRGDDKEIEGIMDRVLKKTDLQGYKIILFSLDSCSMNHSHVMFSLCLARYLKKKYNPIIILGGLNYFVDFLRKNGCDRLNIDYVIENEGEEVVAELLSSLIEERPYQGPGKETEKGIISSVKVPAPVMPDFDGLPLDRYRYRGLKTDCIDGYKLKRLVEEFNQSRVLLLPIRFIKGCTNRCIFCASSLGGLLHLVPPSTVAEWLQALQTKYNPTGFLFLNDTLNISNKYLNELCDEIIKRRLRILWSDCARVDRLDKESIYKMREAGCIRIVYGMETASKRLLDYINKDIDLGQLEEMLYWANKVGIWTGIEIIAGLPYESKKDVKETISFVKRNKKHIDALYYNAFNIKDTSLLSKYHERYGITNIFEISNYEDGFSTFVKYSFDETRGLKWPEKRIQIVSTLDKIIKNFGASPFPEHEYEQFLFFLYSKYDDKKIIKKLFYSVGAEKMRYAELLRKRKMYKQYFKLYKNKTLIYGGR